jgi:hypothetical protein|tara:strand:- start:2958 stop:3362 length:405 start_codon:yes stop_codon:yes gene_type:complete
MANEAVIIELMGQPKGRPVRFTVADGAGIEKGTLCKITDPRTAAATSADNDAYAGIANAEKVASDGSTSLGLWTCGIFDIKASAAVTAGEKVSISGANTVTKVAAADTLFSDVGVALETASTNEVIAIACGIYN